MILQSTTATTKEAENDKRLFDELEIKLSRLAMRWRTLGVKGKPDEQAEVAALYSDLLSCLMRMGYTQWLDTDSELPDRLMPREYLERR